MDILNARPAEMSYEEYKKARALQNKALQIYGQGNVVYCSSVRTYNKKKRQYETKTGKPFKKLVNV
jgi:hypothetical protein